MNEFEKLDRVPSLETPASFSYVFPTLLKVLDKIQQKQAYNCQVQKTILEHILLFSYQGAVLQTLQIQLCWEMSNVNTKELKLHT